MAYLINIQVICNRCRNKRAVVELYDWANEARGRFCVRCGNIAKKERDKFEETHNRDGSLRVHK